MNIKEKAFKETLKFKGILAQELWITGEIKEKDYNYELSAEKNGRKMKLLIYFGKKGVRTVIQGNKTTPEYAELLSLTGEESLPLASSASPAIDASGEYIGSDEAGKGDFFGPLVTAAAYTDESIRKELVALGVRDSKDLSDMRINDIAIEIRRVLKGRYSIISLKPTKYNELYGKFNNLNRLLDWCHSKVIEDMLIKVKCGKVITDQFSKKTLDISGKFIQYPVDFIQVHKAEQYTGVAAASILARSEFNRWFSDIEKKTGILIPKGASARVSQTAEKIFKDKGESGLVSLAKLHFKTYNNIRSRLGI